MRESTQLGIYDVNYELSFTTPTVIRQNSYALLTVPLNEVKIREVDLECFEIGEKRRKNLDCYLVDGSDPEYVTLRIENLCKSMYCEAGSDVTLWLNLANANKLIFEDEKSSIKLSLFTKEGYPIMTLTG